MKSLVRRLIQTPLFTCVTLLTLAVAIGANTAIFSVINGVLLKPLSYEDADRLIGVWHMAPGMGFKNLNASPATHFTYLDENKVFEYLGLYQRGAVTVTGLAEPEQVRMVQVSQQTLPALGIQPIVGRWFTQAEDSPAGPETVMLSYAYWQSKFGGDPKALGQRLMVEGRPRDIIGVMPKEFRFLNQEVSLFLPLRLNRGEVFVGNFSYEALARLKPGVTIEQATTDVARMVPMMMQKFPLPGGFTAEMFRAVRFGPNLHPLKQDVVGDIGNVLWVLMGTVGVVLLIACANVANLLLVRAEGRQQELAIRAAMGADWRRIARELLGESLLLAMVGGVLGVAVAYGGLRLLVAIGPGTLPRLHEVGIHPPVLLFTFAISAVAGVLFGLIPVFRYATPRLALALREGGRNASDGRTRHRTRNVLVVSQVALAMILLISSGLMIRTFQAMRQVEPGFRDPTTIQTFRLSIPNAQVSDAEQVARTHYQIFEKISRLPGVTSVGMSNSITMDGNDNNDPVFVEEQPPPPGKLPPMRRYKHISPQMFQTMGNRLIAGRDFTWEDILQARPVAILSENLAREFWPDPRQSIGKRIRESPTGVWREIVGVAGNEHDNGVDKKEPTIVYWPLLKKNFWGNQTQVQRNLAYAVRSPRVGTPGFMQELRQAVWSVNPNLPLARVRTVQEIYEESMGRTSFTLVMLGIAGAMALFLGVVGIYGVISYSVSQRTREIGIRMALGAQQGEVRGVFLRHGFVLTVIGVVLGIGAAVGLTRWMSSLLFGVSAVDPVTYAAVGVGLAAAALLASYLPARRATSIDPVRALRSE